MIGGKHESIGLRKVFEGPSDPYLLSPALDRTHSPRAAFGRRFGEAWPFGFGPGRQPPAGPALGRITERCSSGASAFHRNIQPGSDRSLIPVGGGAADPPT